MMSFTTLWLPILLSAIAVFVLSFLMHMILPWHKSDYPPLPNEDATLDALRSLAIPQGEYMAPRPANPQAMRSPEFVERMKRGPVFILNIMPTGNMSMGKPLGLWFVYSLIVSFFAGHITQVAAAPTADHSVIFHTAGLIAFMGYSFALWQMSIWYHRPWMTTLKQTVDGFIYGAATGLIFGWLWPK